MATILYMGENERALAVRKAILESDDHVVLTSRELAATLKLIRSRDIHAVLLDHQLGNAALPVTSAIKRANSRVPIILLSACCNEMPELLLQLMAANLRDSQTVEMMLAAVRAAVAGL